MRAAAAIAVLLLATTSACSSDDDDIGGTILQRETGRLPDTSFDLDTDFEPGVQVVDITDFEDRAVSGYDRPTPCTLPLTTVESWADSHLACGMCFALLCNGGAYAHVCTHQCETTTDP